MPSPRARTALGLALLAGALTGCLSDVPIVVSPGGAVRFGAEFCSAPGCLARVSLPSRIDAVASAGFHFAGWSGQCSGSGLDPACTLRTEHEAGADFAQNELVVRVTGTGSVAARNRGQTCTEQRSPCHWKQLDREPIDAVAVGRTEFLGFSGVCSGTSGCTADHGELTATFSGPARVQVRLVGDGRGTVRTVDGTQRCAGDCSLDFPSLEPLVLVAEPDPESVFDGFERPCAPDRCTLTGASSVTAWFSLRRTVQLVVRGDGVVELDGGALCPGACQVELRADAGLVVSTRPGERSRLSSVSPPCRASSGAACTLPTDAGTVEFTFDSVLHWAQAFEVRLAPSYIPQFASLPWLPAIATERGVWATVEHLDVVEAGGVAYGPARNETALFVAIARDGGLQSVLRFDAVDGGLARLQPANFVETERGTTYAFGECRFGLQELTCDSSAFALELGAGGVLRRQVFRPTGPLSTARGAGLTATGAPIVALGVTSDDAGSGLYALAPTLDAPPAPILLHPRFRASCGRGPKGLRCSLPATGRAPGQVCGAPNLTPGNSAAIAVDVTGEACALAHFIPMSSLFGSHGPFSTAEYPHLLFTANGPQLPAPLQSPASGLLAIVWYGADGGVDDVREGEPWESSAQPPTGSGESTRVTNFHRYAVTGYVTNRPVFFGRPLMGTGLVLALWDTQSHALDRVWLIEGEVRSRNATLSGNRHGLIVSVIGRNLRFDGQPLGADPTRTYQHVLFFDDR